MKSTFESQDLTSPLDIAVEKQKSEPEQQKYQGKERRRGERRKTGDRRNEVRFEVDKADRRKNNGRRSDDSSASFW